MKRIESFFVSPYTSLIDVLKKIDESENKIAFVVDDSNVLLGVITDGDIRRFLIKGNKLDCICLDFMRTDYKFVFCDEIHKAKILVDKKIATYIPILDKHKKIIDIYYQKKLSRYEIIKNPVVFMAGGKGKRLMPFTKNCPKPMLKIGGKPILERLLEKSIKSGFQTFYFSVNYLKNQIIDYFKNGEKWGVEINYLIEEKPSGTVGSLSLIKEKIEKPIVVVNGDVLTSLDYKTLIDFHDNNHSKATICSREYVMSVPFGVLNSDGIKLKSFAEKPSFTFQVNAGIYVINPDLLKLINKNEFMDMPDLIKKSQNKDYKVNIFPIYENWLDIGRPEALNEASKNWEDYN